MNLGYYINRVVQSYIIFKGPWGPRVVSQAEKHKDNVGHESQEGYEGHKSHEISTWVRGPFQRWDT